MNPTPDPFGPPRERRRFLGTLARAAALGALARWGETAGVGAAAGAWQLRLSTSSIMFRSQPIEQACETIARLGFDAIDIWSAHEGCPHLDDVAKRLGGARLKALLEKTGLKLCSFSVYAGGFPRYAELLGQAGGGVAIRGSDRPCPPAELTARMRGFLEALKPEIELAEKHQSRLAIENHGDALLHTPDSFKAFVDLNRSPHLGIALAPYHLQAGGYSVEEAIGVCGKQLLYFYAWQHAPSFGQLPGHGPTDFVPWLEALARVNYAGFVNPFMHGEAEPEKMVEVVAKSRDYLRACHARMG